MIEPESNKATASPTVTTLVTMPAPPLAPAPVQTSSPAAIWNQPRWLLAMTAILSAIWPSVTAVSGLFSHWQSERREERKSAEELRNAYLNRMQKLYEAASTDNQRLQHTKAQYILRDNQAVLLYVTLVSEDPKLRSWADSEKRRVQDLIDAESLWLESDTKRQVRASLDELHAKQADLHIVEDELKQKKNSAVNVPVNSNLLRQKEELQGQVRGLQEKFNTVVAEHVPAPAPSAAAVPRAPSPGPSAESPPQPPPVVHTPHKILWVDDHPMNNAELIRILRANGAEVVTAISTAEAEEVLKTHRFDLILSDVDRDSKPGPGSGDDGRLLLRAMRQRKDPTPFLFYAIGGRQLVKAEEVVTEGAQGITDVPTELFAKISYFLPGFKIDVSKALW